MANATDNPNLQNLGSGDRLALALKEYGGMVLSAFDTATLFVDFGMRKTITSGSSHQFPATWKMNDEEHDPGHELKGNNEPITEERVIPLDTKERVAHTYVTTVQEFIEHFDTRQERADEAAGALGRTADKHQAAVIINGARQPARGPNSEFPSGNTLDSPRSGPKSNAYPISKTGSQNLQSDLGEIAQKMDEKDVPREGRVAWISPREERVLRQDTTLLSRDFQDQNTLLTRRILVVEGFEIRVSNQVPSTNVTGRSNSNYNGDFSKTVAVCAGHQTAAGFLQFGGVIPFGPTWIPDKLSWLIGARLLKGQKWLRPEACGEIAMA